MRAYKVVDVFSSTPFAGNPVACILDAEGLSDAEMQSIARWTNLSETTFVLPTDAPEADYRLRIFTPQSELPFAGHPTLGSAHAVLEAGRATPRGGKLVQECDQGLVRISVDENSSGRRYVLELPEAILTPVAADDVDELEAIIGAVVIRTAAPAIVNVGAVWVVAQVADAETLLSLRPDFVRSALFEQRLGVTGISLFGAHGSGDAAIEVRSFAPSCGVEEDPVCGSGNGSIGVFRHLNGMIKERGETYLAAQGQKVGRKGRITVGVDANGGVTVGGACVTCVEGMLRTR